MKSNKHRSLYDLKQCNINENHRAKRYRHSFRKLHSLDNEKISIKTSLIENRKHILGE